MNRYPVLWIVLIFLALIFVLFLLGVLNISPIN